MSNSDSEEGTDDPDIADHPTGTVGQRAAAHAFGHVRFERKYGFAVSLEIVFRPPSWFNSGFRVAILGGCIVWRAAW